MFEKYSKSRIIIFQFWHFPPFSFCPLVTLFDHKLQVFKNSPKWTFLASLIHPCPMSTQNVNIARFARNVQCDFWGDFQILWALIGENRGVF